jgi:hypothetical protein
VPVGVKGANTGVGKLVPSLSPSKKGIHNDSNTLRSSGDEGTKEG